MKHGILYAAIAAALGAGAYYAVQQQNADAAGTLTYVPADTLVFMGDLEPASWKETVSPLQARFSQLFTGGATTSIQEIERLQNEIIAKPEEWNDGLRFIFGLYAEYVTMLTKGTINPQDLGLADKLDAAFYTVGALPVLRFKLENEANFDNLALLKQGQNFKIIELNGSKSEPTHMYDPKHSLFFAWKEIYKHWKIMSKIAAINKKSGTENLTLKDGIKILTENLKIEKKLRKLSLVG
jgi:hypothetical protein